MAHRNAPLSAEGRRRLIARCQTRPIAHVAAEMGISRACASKWVNRWRRHGEAGLQNRSSTPRHSPTATPPEVIRHIEAWRREHKWSARRITDELADLGIVINRRTISRHLSRLGLGQRRFIDPSGENNRKPGKIVARWPGHMAHLDVKKVGRIPDGGGWRIYGRNSAQAREFASEGARSAAIAVWNIHYNYHRPHSGTGGSAARFTPPRQRHERPALLHPAAGRRRGDRARSSPVGKPRAVRLRRPSSFLWPASFETITLSHALGASGRLAHVVPGGRPPVLRAKRPTGAGR